MVTVTVVKIVMTVIVKLEQKKLLVKEDGTEIELITVVIINEDERCWKPEVTELGDVLFINEQV